MIDWRQLEDVSCSSDFRNYQRLLGNFIAGMSYILRDKSCVRLRQKSISFPERDE